MLASGGQFCSRGASREAAPTSPAASPTWDAAANTAVWTAADGDTVTNRTVSFVRGEELSPGVFGYEQALVITGGTGRFADASGSATVVGLIDFDTYIYLGRVEGYISQPGGP